MKEQELVSSTRVIVVEDDPDTQRVLQDLLTMKGYQVRAVSSGEEALAILPAEPPDLLLLDVALPGMDGYEVCRRLRTGGGMWGGPILFLTAARPELAGKVAGFEAGGDDYVLKPFASAELLARVRALARRWQAEQALEQRTRELAALNAIAKAVSRSLDLGELLTIALDEALEVMGLDCGAVILVDETGKASARVRRGVSGQHLSGCGSWVVGQHIAGLESLLQGPLVIEGPDDPRLSASLAAALRAEGVGSFALIPLRPKGKLIGLLSIGARTRRNFPDDELRLLSAVSHQIGLAVENACLYQQVREQLDELRRTQEQLLASVQLATIGSMAAGLSHEINNPLTTIIGNAQLLRSELPGWDRAASELQAILNGAQRISTVINNFGQFAQPRPQEPAVADANRVVERVLNLVTSRLEDQHITLIRQLAPNLPPVLLRASHLQQVFVNLILNAIEAMPNGGELSVTSDRRIADRRESIEVRFKDAGVGIPQENLERIFDPGFTTKVEAGRSRGLGLGLFAARNILEAHGGQIQVESQPGRGSTFIVILPVGACTKDSTTPRVNKQQEEEVQ
jgi:signal transduction histidine kinase